MSIFSSETPHLTQATQAFIDQLEAENAPPLYELPYDEARKVLLAVQSESANIEHANVQDINLPVGPTGNVPVRIVKPDKDIDARLPIILYIHGGGWVMGDKCTHNRIVRELANKTGAAVVFPEYTNSPDAQFPVPLEQIYAVMDYITQYSDEFNFDDSRLVVAGDSVGGLMATVMTMMSKERGGPRIGLQVLLYPVTNADFTTGSYRTFSDGPWLTRKAMEWFWDAYAPDVKQRSLPYLSPLKATTEQLKSLPPAFIITVENDVLRDEGEAYARKLIDADVPVTNVRYNGTIHDFMILDPLASSTPTQVAIEQVSSLIKGFLD